MAEHERPSRDTAFEGRVHRLILAAETGDRDSVAELLSKDASLASARAPYDGHRGTGALHKASSADVAQLLLDHGADVNEPDDGHQSTPLTWAVTQRNDPALVETLRRNGAEPDIYTAALLGDLERVRVLLGNDPDLAVAVCPFPDLCGGMTALHCAATQGHAEVARLLLEQGADVRVRRAIPPDGDQSHALDALGIARRGNRDAVVALLS